MLLKIAEVMTPAQVHEVLTLLQEAPFEDGAATGHPKLKRNMQLMGNSQAAQKSIQLVGRALFAKPQFTSFAMPRNLQIMFNRYETGMFYREHMDATLMGGLKNQALRTDLSFTLFLSDLDSYDGGEFVIRTGFGELRVREPSGTVICYPSGMPHRVEPVTRGVRWASVGWIQSFIRNLDQRMAVYELDQLRLRMTGDDPDHPENVAFGQIRETLLRQWVEL